MLNARFPDVVNNLETFKLTDVVSVGFIGFAVFSVYSIVLEFKNAVSPTFTAFKVFSSSAVICFHAEFLLCSYTRLLSK